MANKDAAFGLRPARMMNGSAFMNQQNRYRIASGATTAIFQGDLVETLTAGTIGKKAAGETDAALGVFNGCRYTDPTTGKDIEAFVIDAPDVVYEIQADAAFPVADLFGNFDIVVGTGDTNSGLSRTEIGVSTGATTATLPLKAIDISQDPENSDVGSANTNVMVVINNHLLSGGTAGLA
jgi:hypothetical protein